MILLALANPWLKTAVQAEAELEKLGISKPIHLEKISRFAQDPILKPIQVFFSYSKPDTGAEAQLFYESLSANKLEVFLDIDNLFPMKEWKRENKTHKIPFTYYYYCRAGREFAYILFRKNDNDQMNPNSLFL